MPGRSRLPTAARRGRRVGPDARRHIECGAAAAGGLVPEARQRAQRQMSCAGSGLTRPPAGYLECGKSNGPLRVTVTATLRAASHLPEHLKVTIALGVTAVCLGYLLIHSGPEHRHRVTLGGHDVPSREAAPHARKPGACQPGLQRPRLPAFQACAFHHTGPAKMPSHKAEHTSAGLRWAARCHLRR